MVIGALKESGAGEKRAPLIALHCEKLCKLGTQVLVQRGIGEGINVPDSDYEKSGAKVVDRNELLGQSDILLRINLPEISEISTLKTASLTIGYLDPYNRRDLVESLASAGVSAFSVELIPRTTRAQKMDVLSSQANLAGYAMVLIAAEKIDRILPMMMTPAGTISPARVFVIGAGVAGLQAIATARRLGARVEAFDTREVVAEQVQSLGARFVQIDLGETGQTKDGYAKALTPEQLDLQRAGLLKICANSDIVITTAQIPGKKAPRIITAAMLNSMRPGSVVVDMAVGSGGNVEGSVIDQDVSRSGVTIIGVGNLPSRVAAHASQMYSSNMVSIIEEYWDKSEKRFVLKIEDEIVKGALVTHNGEIVNKTIVDCYATLGGK